MEELSPFSRIVKDPGSYAREWKQETNGKVVGHFCSYTPEEIITAAGALPFRILASGGTISKADTHLQAYSCSLVRGALEDALSGSLDFLDGTVFPHTCDSIQRLSDIWRLNTDLGFHADLVMPVKLNTASARDYMIDVLRRFQTNIEKGIGTEITSDRLKDTIRTFNRIRENLARIYAIRRDNPDTIRGSDIHVIFKAAMVMDRNRLARELDEFTNVLEKKDKAPSGNKKRIVLAGGLCSMPDIYDIIEESGGVVVWDDFCTGSRYFEGMIDEAGDPIESIADRYLERVVCPAKHSGIFRRGEYLLDAVKQNRADGVIFLFLKFCDPHAFDYPYMKEQLEKEGIPSTLFEIEDQFSSQGQLKTRCEALMEML